MAYKIQDFCVCCGACEYACDKYHAISMGEEHYEIDPEKCKNCGACAAACQIGAPIPDEA